MLHRSNNHLPCLLILPLALTTVLSWWASAHGRLQLKPKNLGVDPYMEMHLKQNYLTLLLYQKTKNGAYTSHHHFIAFENYIRVHHRQRHLRITCLQVSVDTINRWRALHSSGDSKHAWPLCSKGTLTLGHVPAKISKVCWFFLRHGGISAEGNWVKSRGRMFFQEWVFLCETTVMKALKCQTLGAAVHVNILVCWLEIDHCLMTLVLATLSVHSVLFLPMQSSFTSFWHSFTVLVQLIFSFLAH